MTSNIKFTLRRQMLQCDDRHRAVWIPQTKEVRMAPSSAAIIVCDVWDSHWCRGARERLEQMLPTMDSTLRSARDLGCTIIHAPSNTLDFYADSPARLRMLDIPAIQPPEDRPLPDPPLPVDDSDNGSDTGETETFQAWQRQHPAITIDDARDWISDSGTEIYSLLHQLQIEQLFILGVHTNMCILHRTFGIKQMVRWGVDIALVRDLTDSMYNPAMRPYVSHEDGTRLVVEFIEKFWCPTLDSGQLRPDSA